LVDFAHLRPHVALRGLYYSAVWAAPPVGWCPPPLSPMGLAPAISFTFLHAVTAHPL
jgi:hypothetical protein